jgi:hypothetical protein
MGGGTRQVKRQLFKEDEEFIRSVMLPYEDLPPHTLVSFGERPRTRALQTSNNRWFSFAEQTGSIGVTNRPVCVVHKPLQNTDGIRSLKAFLKTALRRCRLRCVGISVQKQTRKP